MVRPRTVRLVVAGRQIVLGTTLGCQPIMGSDPPPDQCSGAEEGVDLAGDVAFEHPDDLAFAETFLGAAGDVGAGAGIAAHAADHDDP